MALGPPVPATSYVLVYNPSQYINSITNGQNLERLDALKHLLECIGHSDLDLITLGSIWLCVTGLLTNEEQQKSISAEIRSCALKCILELIKIEQLQRRFFNIWLTFDFLARYRIENDKDAALWLDCFNALTDTGKRIDLVDDRLRARLFIQFIHGILNGSFNRNHQAYQILKDLLTTHCHLRHDEMMLILEYIFRHLNDDEDDTTNLNQTAHQQTIKKSLEFLCWLTDYHSMNTTLIHYFIQNVVDLHDKSTFSTALNTELIQLITNHLAKAPWHSISVISVLCGIIVEKSETSSGNDIDPLPTLLFILTQTLIDVRQSRTTSQHHIQVSTDDIIHRKCFQNTIQQLPLCWLTILHQVLVKHQNVNKILVNFHQFLTTISTEDVTCALHLFDMTVWKMMHEIMAVSFQYLTEKSDQRAIASARGIYQDCLSIFEELANKLCCLPHAMVAHLFDIKRLTSIPKTALREQMIKQSIGDLQRLLRPNNPGWSVALRELIEYVILNCNESVATRIDVLTSIFDKYLWFKMTDQIANIGQMILECLENLIHIDLTSLTEDEYLSRHITMKQNAIKSIFEHYLSDHTIDSNLAQRCYQILQTIYEQDCQYLTSNESVHRRLIEFILEQLFLLFEKYLSYNRLTSFNHCSFILNFILRQVSLNYSNMKSYLQRKTRLLIWQLLFSIRIRVSDSVLGLNNTKSKKIDYGIYRYEMDHKSTENENSLDLHDYLKNIVQYLKQETPDVLQVALEYLADFLKEQSMVHLSHINIEELIPLLIDLFRQDLMNENSRSTSFHCLIACTYYRNQITDIHSLINCFMTGLNSSKPSFVILSIQACLIAFANLRAEIPAHLPEIILTLMKISTTDVQISKSILEFLMHLLFENFNDPALIRQTLQIFLDIIHHSQYQTAHNLLLAHTMVCFYFNQLSATERQIYAYFLIRSLQQTAISRDNDSTTVERPPRLQRSGSLSSLNDDGHGNELLKRKMTVLDAGPPPIASMTSEEHQPCKKLNDDLIRITISYLNNHLREYFIPKMSFILLPREVRRHHVNNCWLADEQLLYQIKSSSEFLSLTKAKDILAKLTYDLDDSLRNRFRRYTDGNRQYFRRTEDLQTLTTCQDDLHIRPLELDTNRSMFNERNLWISVAVRSLTSTKTFLAINLSASSGMNHSKNEKLHWFEAVEISDTGLDKSALIRPDLTATEHEENPYSIDEVALKSELSSMIMNTDRKDEEGMLNRHNETYYPQTVHRVPSEARKSIEAFDTVEPVRIAKIGVVYIRSGQEITEINILSNIQTSTRYKQFMTSLAKLRSIKVLQGENFYCPLLDANNPDNCGQYAYVWQNSVYQVLFHTSTTLPNTRADHEFKKKLIGNDYVIIVYNENDPSFDMKTLKSGVCQYVIEVCPQTSSRYSRIRIRKRTNVGSQNCSANETISFTDIDYLIVDEHVGAYVRTLALCLCQQSELETRQRSFPSAPYLISPWQSRLQALRSLHTRCLLSYTNRQSNV